jgi:hypothetical protein
MFLEDQNTQSVTILNLNTSSQRYSITLSIARFRLILEAYLLIHGTSSTMVVMTPTVTNLGLKAIILSSAVHVGTYRLFEKFTRRHR